MNDNELIALLDEVDAVVASGVRVNAYVVGRISAALRERLREPRRSNEAVRRGRDWLKVYQAMETYEGIAPMFRNVAQIVEDLLAASSPSLLAGEAAIQAAAEELYKAGVGHVFEVTEITDILRKHLNQ